MSISVNAQTRVVPLVGQPWFSTDPPHVVARRLRNLGARVSRLANTIWVHSLSPRSRKPRDRVCDPEDNAEKPSL